jgi:hypothetical protein
MAALPPLQCLSIAAPLKGKTGDLIRPGRKTKI